MEQLLHKTRICVHIEKTFTCFCSQAHNILKCCLWLYRRISLRTCVCVCVKNACVAQRRDIIYALVVMCGHTVFRYRIELACSNTANPITTQIADCDLSFRLRNRISNINFRHSFCLHSRIYFQVQTYSCKLLFQCIVKKTLFVLS